MTIGNQNRNDKPEQDPVPTAEQEAKTLQHNVAADAHSAHMGATEEQMQAITPPNQAIDALSEKPVDPADVDDSLTADLTPG